MCGIFGAVNYNISEHRAKYCLDQLEHRGPDGFGLIKKDSIVLGHRRLSILDLSESGKQPMEYLDGRYTITFNGEIYNFIEIRQELIKRGYYFYSDTDTEVVLCSYIEWGEKCLDRFNGMWAFAIWDDYEKKLFLSRDRFGIKPLFYSIEKDGKICFASEMKAIVPILSSVTINRKILKSSNATAHESTENCLINEIRRLPAGTNLIFHDGKIVKNRWWNTLDHIPSIPDRYEEQVELFRELFLDACRIRMRSDVKIGTALSGGLDSSATICAMAQLGKDMQAERMCKDWQHAFVASFPNTSLDETEYAKMVTDYLGIPGTFINIDPQKYLEKFEDWLYAYEEMYITSPIPMMATYHEVKSAGVTVTLDGHGADELFCGYPFDFMKAFPDTKGNKKEIEEILTAYYNAYPHENSNLAGLYKNTSYSFYMLKHYVKKIIHFGYEYACKDIKHPMWDKLDSLNKLLYTHTHTDILPTLLRNYDRYSMSAGVEIRMPFMDYRLVEMAFAIPWTSKIRDGYSKAIIRDALEPYMPHEVVWRKTKIGFNTPIVEWMQGGFREYFEDTVTSVDFLNSDSINAKVVKEKILSVTRGDKNVSFSQGETAYAAIAPYLWEKCFYKRVIQEK